MRHVATPQHATSAPSSNSSSNLDPNVVSLSPIMICMKRGKTWAVKKPVNCSPNSLTNPWRHTLHPRLFLKVFSETGWVPAIHLHLLGLQGEWQFPNVSIYDWNNTVNLELLSTLEPFTVHSARGHKIVTWAWDVQSRPKTCCNREPVHLLLSYFVHFPNQRSSLRRLTSKTRVWVPHIQSAHCLGSC